MLRLSSIAVAAVGLAIVFPACGGDDGDKEKTAAPRQAKGVVLLVPHRVADFDRWKPVFEEHREVRRRYGGSRDLVYRDLDDPDNVTVYMTYPSKRKAEDFFADPSLAQAMRRAGVEPPIPPPHEVLREVEVVDYENPGSGRAGDEKEGVQLVIRHKVKDFKRWKPVFDEHRKVRERYGGTGHRLYTPLDDPNDAIVYMTFPSQQKALAFYRDPSLAAAMKRAGVKGPRPSPRTLRRLDEIVEY